MLIAQITDMHITASGDRGPGGAPVAANLARMVAHLNALPRRPDVVLGTGDLVEDGSPAANARLRALLEPLEAPVYLIPGNHDDRETLRAAFPDHSWLSGDELFVHYVIEDWPIRLIALDTLVPGQLHGLLCEDRLAWLDERLAAAPDRPTVLFMHHPPFATGMDYMDSMACRGADALGAIVRRNPQIERILCGHVHRPVDIRWNGTVVSIAPSTAIQLELVFGPTESAVWVDDPIACRLFWWRPGTGLVGHTSLVEPAGSPAIA